MAALRYGLRMASAIARIEKGRRGEEIAGRLLARLGYRILARNFRSRFGEIDLVVQRGSEIVFVEVRNRPEASARAALESVGDRKRSRLVACARFFLAAHGLADPHVRFDVIAIGRGGEEILHVIDAFQVDD